MMKDDQTISPGPPKLPGMNLDLLRKEGVEIIQRLAGGDWTDYNAHDPGLTILEHVCHAITDLCYRLDFEMEDLLAYPKEKSEGPISQFFTAPEILTVNPVTINDYRKLLIDVEGVKNAWLETDDYDSQPRIFHDPRNGEISFDALDLRLEALMDSTDYAPQARMFYDPQNGEISSERLIEAFLYLRLRDVVSLMRLASFRKVKLRGFYKVILEKDETSVEDIANDDWLESVRETLLAHRNLGEDFAEITVLTPETLTLNIELDIRDSADPDRVTADVYSELSRFISPEITFYSADELLRKGKSMEEIFSGPLLKRGFIDDEELRKHDRKKEIYVSDLIALILDQSGIQTVRKIQISGSLPKKQSWVLELSGDSVFRIKDIGSMVDNEEIRLFKNGVRCKLNKTNIIGNINNQKALKRKPPLNDEVFPLPRVRYRELDDYLRLRHDFPSNYGIADGGLPNSASDLRKAQAKQLRAYLMFFDQILANHFAQLDQAKNLLSVQADKDKTYFINQPPKNEWELLDLKDVGLDELAASEDGDDRKHRLLDHLLARFGEDIPNYALKESKSLARDKLNLLKNYAYLNANRARGVNYKQFDICALRRIIFKKLGRPAREEDFFILDHILLYPGELPDTKNVKIKLKEKYRPDPYSFQITLIYPKDKYEYSDEDFQKRLRQTLDSEIPVHINANITALAPLGMRIFNGYYKMLLLGKKNGDPIITRDAAIEIMGLLGITESRESGASRDSANFNGITAASKRYERP